MGYWSALLGFAYYFGALLGNLGWGLAADRVGRRPVLLGGVLGSGVLSCLFGFSRRYWLSVALRFVWGLLNTTGVSRTAVMEVLDDSNSAQGMVLYSVVSGLGRLVGPLVGMYVCMYASVCMLAYAICMCKYACDHVYVFIDETVLHAMLTL